jgi:MFS family permease
LRGSRSAELDRGHLIPELPLPARILLLCRGLRGLADGAVSVLLAGYLVHLGFTPVEVGALVTATLLGSALLTIAVGVSGGSLPPRSILLAAAGLMLATGVAFAGLRSFWPLMLVAFVGTLNPSSGDVSVFLPTEQAALAHLGHPREATARFAWYNVLGTLSGAAGALVGAGLVAGATRLGREPIVGERWGFVLYALVAVAVWVLYRSLPTWGESIDRPPRVLHRSRRLVLQLSALFSLDSFGGGFVVQSLLVLWLARRFGFSAEASGLLFFVTGICAAFSQLVSPVLARRIGHIRTMSYTHLPANVFLILAGVVPTAPLAVALLLARMALSQMDVPARQAYVMAMVPPEERPAAAAVTNVPRSLAAAIPPLLAGVMLEHSSFGWPLVVAGMLKAIYDVLILVGFRNLRPAER